MSDNSLMNIGDLAKPATVLIEKISAAIGVVFEPTQIKRKAMAEVEADKIKAIGRIELTGLQHRTMERMLSQESRKQENIESITLQAAKDLNKDAVVQDLNEDWVTNFFKQCDTVSDKEMQILWARILSNEATSPGKFSKRTVNLVSELEKKDADLFTNLCQFVCIVGDRVPLIYEINNPIYTRQGIDFSSLKHLEAIGLISFEPSSGFRQVNFPDRAVVSYQGKPFFLGFANGENEIKVGHAMFTLAGKELATICGTVWNEEFHLYITQNFIEQGLILL